MPVMKWSLIDFVIIACVFGGQVSHTIGENEDDIFEFSRPENCTKNEYFHTETMSCKNCPNNLVSAKNRLKCICDGNSITIGAKDGHSMCDPCKNQTTLTSDGNECIPCQLNGVCQCSEDQIKVERSLNGTLLANLQCLPCPENSYVSVDSTKCLPCSATNYHEDLVNCGTSILHQRIQKQCLERNISTNWPDIRGTYLINSKRGGIDSYYLRTELRLATHLCHEGNDMSCEHLSNICFLTLDTESVPCKLFIDIRSRKKLFYPIGEAETILSRRSIPMRYTLLKNDLTNKLKFVVAKYSLKGELESILNWGPPYFPSTFNNIRFGINIKQISWTTAKDLVDTKPEFFVPYLAYFENDKNNQFLHELPVLNKHEKIDMDAISKWQLIRKFFTVDTVTLSSAVMNQESSNFSRASTLVAVRYLKNVKIDIKVQERHERGLIFPPLIIVEYGELSDTQIRENVDVPIEFEIRFHLTDEGLNNTILLAIAILIGIAIISAASKIWSLRKRNASTSNISTLIWFIIYCFGSIADALLLISLSACIYTFIFYKGQTVLHILLPGKHNEKIVEICTIVAFGAKVVEVLALMYQNRNVEIFFIDWEQPRKIQSNLNYDSPHTSLKKSYSRRFPQDSSNRSQTPSEIIGARRNRTPSKSSQASTPSRAPETLEESTPNYIDMNFTTDDQDVSQNWMVSIWRTYSVANEWLKLQNQRKINVFYQALVSLLILEVLRFKTWSLAVPELTLKLKAKVELVDESFTLKYAIGAMTYMLVYFVQSIITLLYEKYVRNEIQEFVDLCSVANISVFILSHDYYGYYIHGRSVHGYADTDLLSLINDLKREEDNLCAHRGLIPGTTQQTFVVCVSKTFRSFYDAIIGSQNTNERKFSRRNIVETTNWEERWKMHMKMRKFLCGFLDHCYKNVDYTVKEKHFLEKLCDIELIDSPEKSVFYIDNQHFFDRTLMYGNEWTLATFELSTFVLVTVVGGNYILSAMITIILSRIVNFAAKFNRKRNLANKTLIDDRFLMS